MFRIFLCLLILTLTACSSGGAGGSTPSNKVNNLTMQFNNQDISKVDFVRSIGQTKLQLTNITDKPISIASIALNNDIDVVDNKNTDCLTTLSPSQKCSLVININAIYTKVQALNVTLTTDSGDNAFSIPVWNYNWSKTSLALSIESHPAFNYYNELNVVDGDTTLKLTNSESAPIYIESITFNTSSRFNKLIESENTCGGTLSSQQECFIHIDYEDIGSHHPFAESLVIGARDTSQNFAYTNKTTPPELGVKFNCKNPGICNINFMPATEHKLILESIIFTNPPEKEGVVIVPTKTNGCKSGIDLATAKYCGLDISATKMPTDYSTDIRISYRYYLDDTTYEDLMAYTKDYISVHIADNLSLHSMTDNIPSLCSARKGQKDSSHWQDGWLELYAGQRGVPYIIKKVELIPSATNYEDYDTKTLITPEQAIFSEDCTKTILGTVDDRHCWVRLQAGCQGYGSAGVLNFTYTVGDNPTEFHFIQQLPDIEQPRVDISAGYGSDIPFKYIWKTGQGSTLEPIHVNIPQSSVSFHIANDNWGETGTFTKISENYERYKSLGIPNCFGHNGMDASDNFFPTGRDSYCGMSMDLKGQVPGSSVPFTLWVGSRAQDKVDVIFDVQNINYKKPIFLGAVK